MASPTLPILRTRDGDRIVKPGKARQKKQRIIKHREERYNHAIQKAIDGKAKPGYATERWEKLKEAKGKGK